jgi:DNA polymerase
MVAGTIPCDIAFIGEAPGVSENVVGKPFVGPAGKLLRDGIIANSVPHTLTFALLNLLGCIPFDEDGVKAVEPPEASIKKCAPRVASLIELCKPKLIVCVGQVAEKWLDRVIPYREARHIKITHPAAILRANIALQRFMVERCIVQIREAILWAKLGGQENGSGSNKG